MENTNQDFILDMRQRQAQAIKIQDDNLDIVYNKVTNIKQMSIAMSNELDNQNSLINDVNHQVDDTHSTVKGLNTKIKKLIKQTSCSACSPGFLTAIVFLAIVIIVLLFVIIYT